MGEPAGRIVGLRWAALGLPGAPTADEFMHVAGPQLFSEVGSRGLRSAAVFGAPTSRALQPGRFRYSVDASPERPAVRMLFSDYLAVECQL